MKSFELSLYSPQEVSRRRGRRLQWDEGELGGECFKLVPRQEFSVGGAQNCPSIRVIGPRASGSTLREPYVMPYQMGKTGLQPSLVPSGPPEIQVNMGGPATGSRLL